MILKAVRLKKYLPNTFIFNKIIYKLHYKLELCKVILLEFNKKLRYASIIIF